MSTAIAKAPPKGPPPAGKPYTVNIHSTVAVYVQIENQIQMRLMRGTLKSGDQLPSVREMSDTLDVNPNTVAKAYRDLEVMGLLYTRRGMGVYIEKDAKKIIEARWQKYLRDKIAETTREARESGMPFQAMIDHARATYTGNGSVY